MKSLLYCDPILLVHFNKTKGQERKLRASWFFKINFLKINDHKTCLDNEPISKCKTLYSLENFDFLKLRQSNVWWILPIYSIIQVTAPRFQAILITHVLMYICMCAHTRERLIIRMGVCIRVRKCKKGAEYGKKLPGLSQWQDTLS